MMIVSRILLFVPFSSAFLVQPPNFRRLSPAGRATCRSTATFLSSDAEVATEPSLVDPSEMRIKEIQAELKEMGVSYEDCFDRDSLTRRLVEARRDGPAKRDSAAEPKEESKERTATKATETSKPSPSPQPTARKTGESFDKEGTLEHLRSIRVKQLREDCARRKIRWANFVEKEDMVQALLENYELTHNFSPSGAIAPGQVADLTADQLDQELAPGAASTMLLLDVYATWCGPCQLMAPQLAEAAQELCDSVRVAKLDSDKYADWASKLQVGGLPTVILFDSAGKQVERVEGALMKDGLLQLVQKHL